MEYAIYDTFAKDPSKHVLVIVKHVPSMPYSIFDLYTKRYETIPCTFVALVDAQAPKIIPATELNAPTKLVYFLPTHYPQIVQSLHQLYGSALEVHHES
jgi:hypothetical protein